MFCLSPIGSCTLTCISPFLSSWHCAASQIYGLILPLPFLLVLNLFIFQMLQAMANRRNSTALPSTATAKYGFRLPPPDDCLIAPNVQFHPRDPPQNMSWEDKPITAGTGRPASRLHRCSPLLQLQLCLPCQHVMSLTKPNWLSASMPCRDGVTILCTSAISTCTISPKNCMPGLPSLHWQTASRVQMVIVYNC